jgi:hypothetical protein
VDPGPRSLLHYFFCLLERSRMISRGKLADVLSGRGRIICYLAIKNAYSHRILSD